VIEFLEIHDGPVIPGLEDYEVVYAKDQPQYRPLRVLRANAADRQVFSRWTPTPEQRQRIAEGADIYLAIVTYGGPLQPVSLFIAEESDLDPVESAKALNLTPHQEIPGVQS